MPLLLGLAALIAVDWFQLEIPKLYRMVINGMNDGVVELDEERKAAMVSNLLVVLCGNRDAQPVVNSGSLY